MNMKIVNAMVKIGMQIEREERRPIGETIPSKIKELKADSSRLWKLASNQERNEYQRRML